MTTASTDARPARRTQSAAPMLILAVVGVLNAVGLVMILSASHVQALTGEGSSWYFFNRQLVWVAIGAVALVITAKTDYRVWRRFTVPLVGVSLVLMALVLIPGVGIRVGGSARWLGMGPLRMQPSELAKLAVLLFAADLLSRRADRMSDPSVTIRPVLLVFGSVAVLLMLQPDLGTTLVTGAIAGAVLFVAGAPLGSMAWLAGAGVVGTFLLAWLEPYRWQRMTSFLDPWSDAGNTGYQAAQGLVALASGGLFGVGLGASRAKWGFLPAAHTDFIFAVLGEELGLVGALAVVALFAAIAALGIRTAVRASDRFGMLVAAGATAWVVGQAIVNLAAVVGLVPITGVPLPFVSLGGSSLVITMAVMGMLVNVARHGRDDRRRPASR